MSSEHKSHRHIPLQQIPKSILKPAGPPDPRSAPASPPASAPKVALMPPTKQALKAPPLPPPKPTQKPVPPPLPPPKQPHPLSPPATDQPQHINGAQHGGPSSPLRSPDCGEGAEENGDAGLGGDLEVGSMVEVNEPPLFGVIRWIGQISGISEPVAGIELVRTDLASVTRISLHVAKLMCLLSVFRQDQDLSAGTDGSYLGERHFRCPANKGLFVKLRNCRRDSRFPAPEVPVNQVERCNSIGRQKKNTASICCRFAKIC